MAVLIAIALVTYLLQNRHAKSTAWDGRITSVSYKQSQSVPNFDDSTRTTTDPIKLAALEKILRDDGWHPGDEPDEHNDGCSGGIATTVTMQLSDGSSARLATYACGDSSDRLTTDLTTLVSAWRAGR